jgi:putative endonuclease
VVATSSQRRATGEYGEARAARHLAEDHGMVVLDRNWRCDLGELDLVLRDGAVLVFCEVKTRRDDSFGSPLEAVTEQKVARIRRLAARWLHEHDVRAEHVRIDLVGIRLDQPGRAGLDHVRGVG